MPKVHRVNAAGKAYPEFGISAGETYFWWKFRYGEKIRSRVHPKPSQLTQSAYFSAVYAVEEWLRNQESLSTGDMHAVISQLEAVLSGLRNRFDNLPDGIQMGPTGQLLEGRASIVMEYIGDLRGIEWTGPNPDVRAWRLAINTIPKWELDDVYTSIR